MKAFAVVALLGLTQGALAQEVSSGTGAVLRGLDKIDGQIFNMEMENGAVAEIGRLTVELHECRYPKGNSAGEAFALMTVRDAKTQNIAFSGWMIASSPALNALEHPRYDVWVLRCKTD